ncbi:stage III sporulation protein AF [Bacillus sp. FJAT-27251]|uniref:stage III sporulation protein AF n=1 Tax=Bacillus sp. FJAT-27251 TaxID=1684142 RepID=UPI0006A7DA1C|nr:stage III sporulation protein AF [Bacillus sp. FJAT-27251]
MEFLKEWITNIILFILLATVIDMLLPNSSLQKYVKVVIGLLLISIILSPIMKIFSSDFEASLSSLSNYQNPVQTKKMENLIESKKKEIQASQHAYILEQTAVQLKLDAEEELMARHGMKIAGIEVTADEAEENLSPQNLQSIMVEVVSDGDGDAAVAVVKEVEIDTAQPLQADQNTRLNEEISSLLAEKWNVPQSSIQIVVKGGA